MHKEFWPAFYSLVYLSCFVGNKYIAAKLKEKTLNLLKAFSSPKNVAQYGGKRGPLSLALAEAQEMVELIINLKASRLSPALLAQKQLLRWQAEILNVRRKSSVEKPERENTRKNKRILQEKILALIEQKGSCQTKEIIQILKSGFAPRTIQRHLQAVEKKGLVKRETHGNISRYTLALAIPPAKR